MILEIHAHTNHSRGTKIYYDGISSPEEMVKGAKKAGAEGLFVTDHDKMSGALEAREFARKHKVRVFLGEEISTSDGHLLALGIEELIKPGMGIEESLDEIHAQGGIGIGVHPFDIKKIGTGMKASLCDAIEVFNPMNLDRYSNKKAFRLAAEKNKPMTAGSDAHSARMLGHGQIRVNADDLDGILRAIKKGKASLHRARYMSTSTIADLSVQRLRKSYDYTLSYIEKNYSWPKRAISSRMLSIVRNDSVGIGYFYNTLAGIALGSVMIYGGFRSVLRI